MLFITPARNLYLDEIANGGAGDGAIPELASSGFERARWASSRLCLLGAAGFLRLC